MLQVKRNQTTVYRVAERMLTLSSDLCCDLAAARIRTNQFDEALLLLESLPLPTEEYGAMKCRLGNAQAYCRIGEWGAAVFEVRLIEKSLCRLLCSY